MDKSASSELVPKYFWFVSDLHNFQFLTAYTSNNFQSLTYVFNVLYMYMKFFGII